MAAKYVYFFGGGSADGNAQMKALLGGKGANLAEMANLDCRSSRFYDYHRDLYLLL